MSNGITAFYRDFAGKIIETPWTEEFYNEYRRTQWINPRCKECGKVLVVYPKFFRHMAGDTDCSFAAKPRPKQASKPWVEWVEALENDPVNDLGDVRVLNGKESYSLTWEELRALTTEFPDEQFTISKE